MPVLYARGSRFVAQLAGDLFVVVWCVACGLLGGFVQSVVAAAAVPVRQTADGLQTVLGDFRTAADEVAGVPVIGLQLRRPFDGAVHRLDAVIVSAHNQVDTIERVALLLGWLTFVIPVAVVLLAWVPRRVRFAREARIAQRLVDLGSEPDLFALRALATQPLRRLAVLSDDPASAWRSGDRAVIHALAELELRGCGARRSPPAKGLLSVRP
ncbi:MAG TPA: hypothetical protein VFP34_17915 [Microlunatus sp.]|nr:hypothetical protein [Microlunatus sp.]